MALVSVGEEVSIRTMGGMGLWMDSWVGVVVEVDDHGIRFTPTWATYGENGQDAKPEDLVGDCVLTWKAIVALRILP